MLGFEEQVINNLKHQNNLIDEMVGLLAKILEQLDDIELAIKNK